MDRLEEAGPDGDLSEPIVVEVRDVYLPLMEPLVGPGDQIVGGVLAKKTGRRQIRILSTDPDLEGKIGVIRSAIRELRERLHVELTPHGEDDQPLASADKEAEHWAEFEFLHLLAYAALAVELETERG